MNLQRRVHRTLLRTGRIMAAGTAVLAFVAWRALGAAITSRTALEVA